VGGFIGRGAELLANLVVDHFEWDGLDVVFWAGTVEGTASVEGFYGGDAFWSAVWIKADGVRSAEQHYERAVQGDGDVARAGIVADNDSGVAKQFGKLFETGPAGEIRDGGLGVGFYALNDGRFALGAGGEDVKAEVDGELIGKLGESLPRPAFVAVHRAGDDDGVICGVDAVLGQKFCGIFGGVGVGRKVEFSRHLGRADRADYPEVVVDDVARIGRRGDFFAVEQRGEFTGVGHSDTVFTAGKTGEKSGSQQTLDVDDKVEVFAAKSANEAAQSFEGGKAAKGFAQEFAVEDQNLIKVGVVFEYAGEFGTNEPGYSGVREGLSKRGQCRQGHDDIAERTWFHYQYILRLIGHRLVILLNRQKTSNSF